MAEITKAKPIEVETEIKSVFYNRLQVECGKNSSILIEIVPMLTQTNMRMSAIVQGKQQYVEFGLPRSEVADKFLDMLRVCFENVKDTSK